MSEETDGRKIAKSFITVVGILTDSEDKPDKSPYNLETRKAKTRLKVKWAGIRPGNPNQREWGTLLGTGRSPAKYDFLILGAAKESFDPQYMFKVFAEMRPYHIFVLPYKWVWDYTDDGKYPLRMLHCGVGNYRSRTGKELWDKYEQNPDDLINTFGAEKLTAQRFLRAAGRRLEEGGIQFR